MVPSGRMSRLAPRLALALALAATTARADDSRKEAAREAYERGAAAYDAGENVRAATELARADEISPNPIALELAIKAAVRADDPRLALALASRAESRRGPASLDAAAEAARARMEPRVGRVTARCAAGTVCAATVDGEAVEADAPVVVLPGERRVVIETAGRREAFTVWVGLRERVTVRATAGRAIAPVGRATEVPSEPAGLGPGWFWASVGLTAAVGGAALVSALDTQARHDDFVAAPSAARSDAGRGAQLRTNLLGAGFVASALVSGALGLFFVRWDEAPRTAGAGR